MSTYPDPLWSWALALVGATGLYVVGRTNAWYAWLINLAAQVLWVVYALVTRQTGFIFSALLYGGVYAANAYTWYRRRNDLRVDPHGRG